MKHDLIKRFKKIRERSCNFSSGNFKEVWGRLIPTQCPQVIQLHKLYLTMSDTEIALAKLAQEEYFTKEYMQKYIIDEIYYL